jgi:sirohydrochlorin cobaltochelatase
MYRVTQRLTDAEAQALIARSCCSDGGCLKTILWRISPELPVNSLPVEKFTARGGDEWPLLCHEACNILVAEARKVVKGDTKEG